MCSVSCLRRSKPCRPSAKWLEILWAWNFMSFGKNMKSFEAWRPSTARQAFFGVGKNPCLLSFFFVEIFWTKLSSLEGEILEQEVPWSLGNIAGSQDIDKFEMVVQAFEYEKDHLQPREKAGQPWIFCKLWCPSWLRCNNRFSSV